MTGTAATGAKGYAPTTLIQPCPASAKKKAKKKDKRQELVELYERCYDSPTYRQHSPGLHLVHEFWDWATPYKTQTLIDWGCGTGRASWDLACRGLNVTAVDFAKNCLDSEIAEKDSDSFRFLLQDITKPLDIEQPSFYGYCVDVLEHVPEEDIDNVLDLILFTSKNVYFNISCIEDNHGERKEIEGEEPHPLHCTVYGYAWWLKKFVDRGATIHRSLDHGTNCTFYLTCYTGLKLSGAIGRVNVGEEQLIKNVRHNATLGFPVIKPFGTQDTEVMFLAGGPSLNDFTEEIIQNRKDGMKLVTVNGSYQWALDHGLKPSLQMLIDAREFNKRFTQQHELSDETKFVISSTADPVIFETLPTDRTWIMHTSLSADILAAIEEGFGPSFTDTFPIPGGCTVTLRALAALRMMGFYKFHIYGFDSSMTEEAHHAYEQEENEKDLDEIRTITVAAGSAYEREFRCAPWMIFQAMDFQKMGPNLLHDCQVDIKGDGMIAYMIEVAAKMNEDDIVELEEKMPGPRFYMSEADQAKLI